MRVRWPIGIGFSMALLVSCTSAPAPSRSPTSTLSVVPSPSSTPAPTFDYELDCGPLARALCETRAEEFIDEMASHRPTGVTVVRLRFGADTLDAFLSDGTSMAIVYD